MQSDRSRLHGSACWPPQKGPRCRSASGRDKTNPRAHERPPGPCRAALRTVPTSPSPFALCRDSRLKSQPRAAMPRLSEIFGRPAEAVGPGLKVGGHADHVGQVRSGARGTTSASAPCAGACDPATLGCAPRPWRTALFSSSLIVKESRSWNRFIASSGFSRRGQCDAATIEGFPVTWVGSEHVFGDFNDRLSLVISQQAVDRLVDRATRRSCP